jgi:hypothetical protein
MLALLNSLIRKKTVKETHTAWFIKKIRQKYVQQQATPKTSNTYKTLKDETHETHSRKHKWFNLY